MPECLPSIQFTQAYNILLVLNTINFFLFTPAYSVPHLIDIHLYYLLNPRRRWVSMPLYQLFLGRLCCLLFLASVGKSVSVVFLRTWLTILIVHLWYILPLRVLLPQFLLFYHSLLFPFFTCLSPSSKSPFPLPWTFFPLYVEVAILPIRRPN